MKEKFFLIVCLLFVSVTVNASVSPYDYGLRKARTGVERYNALYKAHVAALKLNTVVSYFGVGELDIEIPKNAKPIPLGRTTNFRGITLTVLNNNKDSYLFIIQNKAVAVNVEQALLDSGNFQMIPELNEGLKLLILEDKNLWIANREGYGYGVKRKDVLLLNNGIAVNSTVMPYGDSKTTIPVCKVADVSDRQKVVKNLNFRRNSASSFKTFLVHIENSNNVKVDNISIYTPAGSSLYGDHVITIDNCTNIELNDIKVDGTYSEKRKYGYAIMMNNVWNVWCERIVGTAEWGIFGNNNISRSYLKDCRVNRYDIHCYGRDITMQNCIFWDFPLGVSSVYGDIFFKGCTFRNNTPVEVRPDYNSYVPFNIIFEDCTYYAKKGVNSLVRMNSIKPEKNPRLELQERHWPTIQVEGLKVISQEGTKDFNIISFSGEADEEKLVKKIPQMKINKIDIGGNGVINWCNKKLAGVAPIISGR